MLSHKAQGKEEEGGNTCAKGIRLSKRLLHVMKPSFLGSSYREVYVLPQWQVLHKYLILLCLTSVCGFCFSYWTALIATLKFPHFYHPDSLSQPTVGKWAGEWIPSCYLGSSHHDNIHRIGNNHWWHTKMFLLKSVERNNTKTAFHRIS